MVGEIVKWYVAIENSMEVLKNTKKIKLSFKQTLHFEKIENSILKRYLFSYVHCSIIHSNEGVTAT